MTAIGPDGREEETALANFLDLEGTNLEPESMAVLVPYTQWFDPLFFGGRLAKYGDRIFLSIVPIGEEIQGPEGGRLGQTIVGTTDGSDLVAPDNIKIIIELAQLAEPLNKNNRLLEYLGTILHKLLHVLDKLFGCQCAACIQVKVGINSTSTGHHNWWQRSAFAVENFVQTKLGMNVDLG